MNKKLFSWKALAGLALLVAMGLTSCQQGSEVDPPDPTGANTPTKPSTSTKGTADLTFTITQTSELATLWAEDVDAKTKEAIREKSTINININSAGYKLDGAVLSLPNFFKGATKGTKEIGKVVNVTFTSAFLNADCYRTGKDGKKQLYLNTDNLAGNKVNFYFPAQDLDLTLEASQTETTLSGAGTNFGYFKSTTATNMSATSLLDGITVKRCDYVSGDLKQNGGTIEALVVDGTVTTTLAQTDNWNGTAGAGFTFAGTTVNSLFIEAGTSEITNISKDGWAINTITIKKGAGVKFSGANPRIAKIVGLDAACTVQFTDATTDAGSTTNLANVGSVEKCVLTLGAPYVLSNTVLKNVELKSAAVMNKTNYAEGITFNALTLNFDNDNQTATFNTCKFKAAVTVNGNFSVATKTESTLYEWVVSGTSGSWVAVKDNKVDNLKEYNKNETIQEFTNYVDAASGTATVTNVAVSAGALTGSNAWQVTSNLNYSYPDTTCQDCPN